MAHLTNFSFEFFYTIFTEDASQPLLYHSAKKSKMTKNSNQGGGSRLNFALNQRSRRSERREVFFVAVGDGAPETNDVFALSAEDRDLPSERPCAATQESTSRRKPRRSRGSVTNRER